MRVPRPAHALLTGVLAAWLRASAPLPRSHGPTARLANLRGVIDPSTVANRPGSSLLPRPSGRSANVPRRCRAEQEIPSARLLLGAFRFRSRTMKINDVVDENCERANCRSDA